MDHAGSRSRQENAAAHPHERHQRAIAHPADDQRRMALTLAVLAGYMIAELVGGLWTNSLALLADAGHMASDVGALVLSLFALRLARRPPTPRNTYGFYRAEILAALVNGSALVAVSIYIFIEAARRFREPPGVLAGGMLAIAAGGLAVNLLALRWLQPCCATSLNIRAAWLHILGDAAGSVGAVTAAGLIWAFGWTWADPLASVLIGVLIIVSAWRLLAETVSILMESAPRGIDADAVRAALLELPGVLGVHDLHIWTITSGLDSLSAHVVVAEISRSAALLRAIQAVLHARFRIEHVTIQLEPADPVEP